MQSSLLAYIEEPASFQSMKDYILVPQSIFCTLAYLDNVIVSPDRESHLQKVEIILQHQIYQYIVLPFGIHRVVSSFQTMIDRTKKKNTENGAALCKCPTITFTL